MAKEINLLLGAVGATGASKADDPFFNFWVIFGSEV
jgi:hypothetical protein